MRRLALLLTLALIAPSAAFAAEIREFDVRALQRLGNELIRVSQTPDRGATDAVRKRARETAITALRGRSSISATITSSSTIPIRAAFWFTRSVRLANPGGSFSPVIAALQFRPMARGPSGSMPCPRH